uniref:Uncharacterized protein n=1 Tax=Chromera velia CCMP2878 TaxID=1169474 RepID=A0A0G4I2Y2_9ALVE|eukprot:Cvel_10534.t1-p1 / transcript=Cvel_10534.t1 / gene=Cvel_10534 / organism=Chromera_velia_CCMP2878 / gene_product=hypothetical protein / transcript_product=hypothetical protein / location=Cvel_scaffold637:65388-66293(-) / protein_length=302 / sequence_SO=supercontig / SO=protein_coding / is_pseudo=false
MEAEGWCPQTEGLWKGGVVEMLNGIASGSGQLPSLRDLELNGASNHVQFGSGSADALAKGIFNRKYPSLRSVKLSCECVDQVHMRELSRALESRQAMSVRMLDISVGDEDEVESDTNSEDEAVEKGSRMLPLAVALGSKGLRGLKVLSLGSPLSRPGVEVLCLALRSRYSGDLRSLRSLQLILDVDCKPTGVRTLTEVLTADNLPALRRLKVEINELNDDELMEMVDVWSETEPPPLYELDLEASEADISDEGVVLLTSLLCSAKFPSLVWVLLNVSSESARTLLQSLFPESRRERRQSRFL